VGGTSPNKISLIITAANAEFVMEKLNFNKFFFIYLGFSCQLPFPSASFPLRREWIAIPLFY
jgi:hypothetical protein